MAGPRQKLDYFSIGGIGKFGKLLEVTLGAGHHNFATFLFLENDGL